MGAVQVEFNERMRGRAVALVAAASVAVGAGCAGGSGHDSAGSGGSVGTVGATAETSPVNTEHVSGGSEEGAPNSMAPDVTVAEPKPTPDLVRLSLSDERRALDRHATVTDVLATEPWMIDAVVAQDPAAGAPLAPDGEVKLTVGVRPVPTLVEATPFPSDIDGVDITRIDVGECATWTLKQSTVILQPVACDQPHRFQLIAEVTLDDLSTYDIDALSADLTAKCEAAFEEFVLTSYADSAVYLQNLYPAEQDWARGDRVGSCMGESGDSGQDLVGSAFWSMW